MKASISQNNRLLELLVLCSLSAACAAPGPMGARPGQVRSPKDSAPCYNLEYGFTCVPPPGFVITQEGPGPGQIMTLIKRSYTSAEEPNLALRVYPLRGQSFERFADRKIIKPLQETAGVKDLQSVAAEIGDRKGLRVGLDREYAHGGVHMEVFCFPHGKEAYLIEYTEPASRPRGGATALDSFVQSLAFR